MKKIELDLGKELFIPEKLPRETEREPAPVKKKAGRKKRTTPAKSYKVAISHLLKKQVAMAAVLSGLTKTDIIEKAIEAYCASINKSYRMNRFSGYSEEQLQAFKRAAQTVLTMPGAIPETKKDAQDTIKLINELI